MTFSRVRLFGSLLIVAGLLSAPPGLADDFAIGSLIIPADTTYQDAGMLKAFGLVYRLLSVGIPVHQSIRTGKARGGADFTASALDVQTLSNIIDHGYRGGPFLVASERATAALEAIAHWHAEGHVTTVHEATTPFTAEVGRTLFNRPGIAVLADGNEIIAFGNLNAAGIPDRTGQAWPTIVDTTRAYEGYPDVLNVAEVAGATATGSADGALFHSNGTPAYCHLASMHYSITPDDEAVREVRQWLDRGPESHLFLQCVAVTVFENSTNGLFLSTAGVLDDGGTPNPLQVWTPDDPGAQFDGPLSGDGGTVNSIGLAANSVLKPSVTVMIEEDRSQSSPNEIQMLFLRGNMDGNPAKGRVTLLAGHNYTTTLPITSNSQTNGVRLFLNSMFDERCGLFVDGFESGATSAWSASVGD